MGVLLIGWSPPRDFPRPLKTHYLNCFGGPLGVPGPWKYVYNHCVKFSLWETLCSPSYDRFYLSFSTQCHQQCIFVIDEILLTPLPGHLQSWFLVFHYCHVHEKSDFGYATYGAFTFWEKSIWGRFEVRLRCVSGSFQKSFRCVSGPFQLRLDMDTNTDTDTRHRTRTRTPDTEIKLSKLWMHCPSPRRTS